MVDRDRGTSCRRVGLVSEATIALGLARALPPPIIDQTQIVDLGVRRRQPLGGIPNEYHHPACPARTTFSASTGLHGSKLRWCWVFFGGTGWVRSVAWLSRSGSAWDCLRCSTTLVTGR